jgi:hypothetical protein
MKSEKQIREKILQHEIKIEEQFKKPIPDVEILDTLKKGRIALFWILIDKDKVEPDELTKKIEWEITCQEASNLF